MEIEKHLCKPCMGTAVNVVEDMAYSQGDSLDAVGDAAPLVNTEEAETQLVELDVEKRGGYDVGDGKKKKKDAPGTPAPVKAISAGRKKGSRNKVKVLSLPPPSLSAQDTRDL